MENSQKKISSFWVDPETQAIGQILSTNVKGARKKYFRVSMRFYRKEGDDIFLKVYHLEELRVIAEEGKYERIGIISRKAESLHDAIRRKVLVYDSLPFGIKSPGSQLKCLEDEKGAIVC